MSVSSVRPTSSFQDLGKAAKDSGFFKDDPTMRAFYSTRQSPTTAAQAFSKAISPSEVFWALGDDWWKQLYDEKFHEYGPEVFDKGLHEGVKEPGYYEDALKACKWVSEKEQLTATPSVELYKNINKIACQHFNGKSTLVAADKTGQFLAFNGKHCEVGIVQCFSASPDADKIWEESGEYDLYALEWDYYRLQRIYFPEKSIVEVRETLKKAHVWFDRLVDQSRERQKILNSYIKKRSKELGLSLPIAIISRTAGDGFNVNYLCSTEQLEQATRTLFAEYNRNMAKASSKEEKLRLIADLYQMLEWMHPFPDGQGRTDLILLMKELCRHGFTPAILDDPYVSTYSTLDEWVDYLKKGMEKWQQEAAKKSVPSSGTKV